jgi:bile acid-coenzyme A ligase
VPQDALVTIALPNGVDFVRATVAAWKLGATPQPLSPRLPADERAAIIELAKPALVVDEPIGTVGGIADPLPDLVAGSWKAPASSGSTGRPKIIRAFAPATVDPETQVAPFIPRQAVQMVAGPLFHAAPFVYAMRGLMTGHELVILPRFDAAEALRTIEQHRITWTMLVPTMMHRSWRLGAAREQADVSSLESIMHMGARCAPWLKRAWIDWLGPERVIEVYAGTESQGLTMITGQDWLDHPESVGRGISGSRFRVVRPDGTACAPDEVGEILMRREGGATYSYVGAEPDVRDGWHSLGDAGRIDAEGYLYVADRLDDVIVTGGAKVQPADVEGVVESHPDVRSAVAVPRDDEELGQRVHVVVDVDEATVTESELDEWISTRIDPEKRPRSWQIVHVPLRDDTGKVRRSTFR